MNPSRDLRRVGILVHPARTIDEPLEAVLGWGEEHGVPVVQIPVPGQDRRVAAPGKPTDCDLIVSIGGDGTMLAGIRAAMDAGLPALGLACGSLGVLTTVHADDARLALDRFAAGDWSPRHVPALAVRRDGRDEIMAINDLAVTRAGIGQVRVFARVDGILYSRLAGDGCIVSTALGSSAYSLAAGGPLLTPEAEAFLFTPLPSHGGSRHSLVVGAGSRLELEVSSGIGGARMEIDGQLTDEPPRSLAVTLRPAAAILVNFSDQEPLFESLRRRRLIVDSPRIVAEDA
jgi:NAD+ kinase